MKKTLVALAALAATASFAQSSVTITGAIATALNSNSTKNGAGATVDTLGFFNNPTGTTSVIFTGVEDLGGGMKGLFLYEMDPNANYNNAVALSGEIFVGVSGGFGSIKLGTPNMPTLSASAGRNPFGTKTGGGYGGVQGPALVRMPSSLRYDSPNFSGFSAVLAYAPEVAGAAAGATASNTAGTAVAANTGPVNTLAAGGAQTDIGLFYSNGPLAAALSLYNRGDTAAASTPGATAGMRQTNYNISYAFGTARVFFGGDTTDAIAVGGASTNSTGNNLGLRYDAGNMTFLGNYAIRRNAAANTDQRIWGLGFDYNFSKRTAAVVRMNNQTNDGAAAAAVAETRNMMVGLIHKF